MCQVISDELWPTKQTTRYAHQMQQQKNTQFLCGLSNFKSIKLSLIHYRIAIEMRTQLPARSNDVHYNLA